jgi:hypothetical protein
MPDSHPHCRWLSIQIAALHATGAGTAIERFATPARNDGNECDKANHRSAMPGAHSMPAPLPMVNG